MLEGTQPPEPQGLPFAPAVPDYYQQVADKVCLSRNQVKRILYAIGFTPGPHRHASVAEHLCMAGVNKHRVKAVEDAWVEVTAGRVFKPNGHVERIREVVSKIKNQMFSTWEYQVKELPDGHPYLVIHETNGRDNVTGADGFTWNSRKWLLSVHMTETEIVNTAWLATKQAIMHELGENFLYSGKMVFNPHMAVKARQGVAEHIDVRA